MERRQPREGGELVTLPSLPRLSRDGRHLGPRLCSAGAPCELARCRSRRRRGPHCGCAERWICKSQPFHGSLSRILRRYADGASARRNGGPHHPIAQDHDSAPPAVCLASLRSNGGTMDIATFHAGRNRGVLLICSAFLRRARSKGIGMPKRPVGDPRLAHFGSQRAVKPYKSALAGFLLSATVAMPCAAQQAPFAPEAIQSEICAGCFAYL